MPLSIVDGVLLAVFFFLLYKVYGRLGVSSSGLPLPPGPRRLPLIGSVHHIPLEHQHVAFMNWKETYGDMIYLQIFNRPSIVLNSAKAMEDLLNKRGLRYSDRPDTILVTEILGFTHNIALMHYGDLWRRHRRWFQAAFQTASSLDSYIGLQNKESMRLVSDIMDISQGSAKKSGIEKGNAIFSGLKRYVGSLMMEISYGHSVSSLDDEYIVLADNAISGATATGAAAASLIDFFPILRHVPAWVPGAGFRKKIDEVRELVRLMIDTPYERVYESTRNGSARPCFLTKLLDDCTIDGQLSEVDETNIKGAATIVYGAGTDTTATTLTTLMLVLTQNPKIQKRAQEDIDKVTGSERLPQFEDRVPGSMPYIEALMKEVYRWNPPFPLALPHRVVEEDTYESYVIPAGSMIIPNVWAILRDPAVYSEPDVFKPERFLSETPERDPQDFVFGFGRRKCVGQQFADASIWLAITRVLATFDITTACDPKTGAEVSFTPDYASGMIRHLHAFPFDVKPRSHKAVEVFKRAQDVE